MQSAIIRTAIAPLLAVVLSAPAALAQTTTGTSLRMPYERDFWGHVGLSIGRSKAEVECPGAGLECDFDDQAFRVYGGGRFNNAIGGEVGFVRFGDYGFAGGELDAKALDFALIAGIPFATNWSVFGKLGLVYARTNTTTDAPGIATGKENGWGPRFGFGLQVGLNENWAIRADVDRYRIKFAGGRDSIDTYTLGAQYTFR